MVVFIYKNRKDKYICNLAETISDHGDAFLNIISSTDSFDTLEAAQTELDKEAEKNPSFLKARNILEGGYRIFWLSELLF